AIQRSLVKLPIVFRLFPVRLNARTVERTVQSPRSRQDRITNRFAFQPPDWKVRQQPVLGIVCQRFWGGLAGLLESLRHHQETNLLLDGPAIANELDSQPIQQLRM